MGSWVAYGRKEHGHRRQPGVWAPLGTPTTLVPSVLYAFLQKSTTWSHPAP